MFYSCQSLKNINLSNWNILETTFGNMFYNCINLTDIDVTNWNMTSQSYTEFNNMLGKCRNLVNIDPSKWNVSKSKNFLSMFEGCNNLSQASIINIAKMFINADNTSAWKNLNNKWFDSPFCYTNIQLNATTIGQDLVDQLLAKGWEL